MAALASDLLCRFEPVDLLLRTTLPEQQTMTVAGFLLLKTVIVDAAEASNCLLSDYLEDLGLRVARRVEGLAA